MRALIHYIPIQRFCSSFDQYLQVCLRSYTVKEWLSENTLYRNKQLNEWDLFFQQEHEISRGELSLKKKKKKGVFIWRCSDVIFLSILCWCKIKAFLQHLRQFSFFFYFNISSNNICPWVINSTEVKRKARTLLDSDFGQKKKKEQWCSISVTRLLIDVYSADYIKDTYYCYFLCFI